MGWVRPTIGIAVMVIGLLYVVWEVAPLIRKRGLISKAHDEPRPDAALLSAQLKLLEQIDAFIGTKDESALREIFDLPGMLKYNIKLSRRSFAPKLVSSSESKEIDRYWKGGQARIDTRFALLSKVNDRVHLEHIPGKIGIINSSAKYVESRRQLTNLSSSSLLPSTVTAALKDFEKTIEDNMTLMVESLNESFASDPRYIFESDDSSSNWYGSASGRYWARFASLREKASAVSEEIRQYLGVGVLASKQP